MIQNSSVINYRQPLNKMFVTAFSGIRYFFKTERNGKIQAVMACIVIAAGFYLDLSTAEWIAVLFCIGAVLSLEMLNTVLEHMCNFIHDDFHPAIKLIKDIAAGAVLVMSVISTVIGLVIFLPKIFALL